MFKYIISIWFLTSTIGYGIFNWIGVMKFKNKIIISFAFPLYLIVMILISVRVAEKTLLFFFPYKLDEEEQKKLKELDNFE